MEGEGQNVWKALTETIVKHRLWIETCAKDQGVPENPEEALRKGLTVDVTLEMLRKALNRDPTLYCAIIKDFIVDHGHAVDTGNCDYFQKMLPTQFQHLKVTPEIMAKGQIYV